MHIKFFLNFIHKVSEVEMNLGNIAIALKEHIVSSQAKLSYLHLYIIIYIICKILI